MLWYSRSPAQEPFLDLAVLVHGARPAAGPSLFGGFGDSRDFLVEFAPLPPAEYAQAYFSLRAELEQLFATAVDLVTVPAVANPFFRAGIDASRHLLYAA